MDVADNDLGLMSADINDLFRSVHRNHESIMEEINVINEKIKLVNDGFEMILRYIDERIDNENKMRIIELKNNQLELENKQLNSRIKRAERKHNGS